MKLIGVNCSTLIDRDLRKTLQQVVDSGYTSCELSHDILPFMIGGEVSMPVVEYARSVMKEFDLNYTAHCCAGLDLRSTDNFELHKKTLYASIDLCSLLGMKLITVHFEEKSKINWIERRFEETYREAAAYAEDKNVLIAIENIEVEDYRYVIDIIEKINHPNFKMTLDVGHLFLSCNYFDQDFKKAVEESLPHLVNCHLNDNTGDFMEMRLQNFHAYKMVPMAFRTNFGLGDIHVPPYFGRIDFDYLIQRFSNIENLIYTCEYERDTFYQFDKQVFEQINAKING